MGYFSRLAMQMVDEDGDRSYPSEEMTLKIRLQDLLTRKEELESQGLYTRKYMVSLEDIDTILPQHISNVHDVNAAIERTYYRLYGEYEASDFIYPENNEDSMCEGQIGFAICNDGELIFDAA